MQGASTACGAGTDASCGCAQKVRGFNLSISALPSDPPMSLPELQRCIAACSACGMIWFSKSAASANDITCCTYQRADAATTPYCSFFLPSRKSPFLSQHPPEQDPFAILLVLK
ncbi:hypothetical protein ABBQ38_002087 [Trebouxia sp. C0009 RCD-2024]